MATTSVGVMMNVRALCSIYHARSNGGARFSEAGGVSEICPQLIYPKCRHAGATPADIIRNSRLDERIRRSKVRQSRGRGSRG